MHLYSAVSYLIFALHHNILITIYYNVNRMNKMMIYYHIDYGVHSIENNATHYHFHLIFHHLLYDFLNYLIFLDHCRNFLFRLIIYYCLNGSLHFDCHLLFLPNLLFALYFCFVCFAFF